MRYTLNVKRPYDDKEGEEVANWTTIGYAQETKKGFNLYFNTLPLITSTDKGHPKVEDVCMFPLTKKGDDDE